MSTANVCERMFVCAVSVQRGAENGWFVVLQEETQEYLEEAKLKELVARYSEFINFPIYLYASKEVDVPADETADESEVSDDEEDIADADDEGVADDGEFACFFSCLPASEGKVSMPHHPTLPDSLTNTHISQMCCQRIYCCRAIRLLQRQRCMCR